MAPSVVEPGADRRKTIMAARSVVIAGMIRKTA